MQRFLRNTQKYISYALDKKSMLNRRAYFYRNEEVENYSEDAILYNFNLKLHPGENYQGLAQVKFNIQQIPNERQQDEFFIDFQGKSLKQIYLNSSQLNPQGVWSKGRISLKKQHLKEGQNNLSIRYENKYDKDGSGCVSFIDVDQKQYLYTQFQPYMANRVFPLFDQPDLKAKMSLSISCPDQWQEVLSNQQSENEIPKKRNACSLAQKVLQDYKNSIPNNYKTVSFKETKLLPTYLYCFVVGPYKKLVCFNTYKNLPMNLYCIQSLYPYMLKLAPFIQQITNLSMKFFEQSFGYPYPFNKYDQVFAHQYKWGAMENAGIVTLNDLYIFKDPVSIEKMFGFGNTIVHQLAHHWFGNLVTMKWWDDLWLNQSFAQYISHYCLQKIKPEVKTLEYQSAMASFLSRKTWGYSEDQLITTHPIRSQVENTDIAESIFDGITYSKGAATMKQLMYLMGQQKFEKALSEYFNKFAFKNAQLDDLLTCLSNHYPKQKSSKTLDQWKQMWLEKQGLNILSSDISEDGKLKIIQQNYHQNHTTMRSHVIQIAVFDSPTEYSSFKVEIYPQKQTIIHLSPKWEQKIKKSKAILLNYKDLTFAKVILDAKSVQFFKNNLKYIEDVLTKSLVWKIFYDMVKDGKLKTPEYIAILSENVFGEKSDNLLEENLGYALLCIHKYTPQKYRSSCFTQLFHRILQELSQNSQLSENRKVILRDKLISMADQTIEKDLTILYEWISQDESQLSRILSSRPNITESWKIVMKILSQNDNFVSLEGKKKLLEKIVERDQSDNMKNKKITCETMLLEPQELTNLFQSYKTDSKWTMVSLNHSLAGFNNHKHKKQIRETFRHKYFETVKEACIILQHIFGEDLIYGNFQQNIQQIYHRKLELKEEIIYYIYNHEFIRQLFHQITLYYSQT